MTTAGTPPDAAGEPVSDARAAAAQLAAAEAARLAAEVRAHEEHLIRLRAEAGARAADDARLVAESRVRELEAQLQAQTEAWAAVDAEDAAASAQAPTVDPSSLSLFDDPKPIHEPGRAADGSDPRLLPMALLGGGGLVGLGMLVAFFSGNVGLGILLLGITGLLLWLASATWVTPIEISVSRGIVYIDQGETKHRFDLRNERTQVEMSGRPGDSNWEVRFVRRGLDPFVVRPDMVDPHTFVTSLHEWRPDL